MSQDLVRLQPNFDVSRRGFVTASLAAGFALAVRPVSAETITTDSEGLIQGEVKIPVKDGEIPAYRAQPDKKGPFPVIVVVQEIFGVHEHIKDLCRRLAKSGYLAIAPDLYVRQGDATKEADIQKLIATIVSKVPDEQVMSDIDATVEWVKKSGQGDTSKLAITGFCWGGRIVWLYSAHSKDVKAGAAWYGKVVGEADPLHPKHPVDVAGSVNAPVLGLYGAADSGIPVASVEKMREALKAAGKPSEIELYPDTPHGFNADYRPTYREQQAKDAWQKMLNWFKKHGVS